MSGSADGTLPPITVTGRRPGAPAPADDIPVLRVGGQDYFGWTSLRITRGMEQQAAEFQVGLAEQWRGQAAPWKIDVFAPVQILLGGDLVLTGHVDRYAARIDGNSHGVTITGRSKTADLIDCNSELAGGEYRGTTLAALARALAAPFGIGVVEEADAGAALDLAALQREDTVWEFLERAARMRGVLLTDDAQGRLVIARAGQDRAAGTLVQGVNILAATGDLDGSQRFSRYTVLGQQPSRAAQAAEPEDEEADAPGAGPLLVVNGTAEDRSVPRYRPRVIMAEKAASPAEARARAFWEARHAAGRGRRASITVQGWRDADGALWQPNRLIGCDIPALQLQDDMLIAAVTFQLSPQGRTTELEVGPPEGFTPEPVDAPAGKAGKNGKNDQWREAKRVEL